MPKSGTIDHEKPQMLGTIAEVAEVLGVPQHTLDVWRSRGKGPAYIKVGRHVRYRWSDVNEWLTTLEVRNAGMT